MALLRPEMIALVKLVLWRPKSTTRIRHFQEEQLRRLIHHAYRTTPFYRNRMNSFRVMPNDIQTLEDLRRIPPCAKEELRKAGPAALISQEYRLEELVGSKTTGSTGVPLEVFKSPVENWIHHLIRLRSMRHFGYRSRLRVVKISLDKPLPRIWQALSWLGLYRQSVIPMTLPPAQIALRILKETPNLVLGAPTILALVAGEIHRRNPTLRLPFAVSGAELLTPD